MACNSNKQYGANNCTTSQKETWAKKHSWIYINSHPQWASIIISTLEQLHNSWHWVSVKRASAISKKQSIQSTGAHQSALSLSVYFTSLSSRFAASCFPLALSWVSYLNICEKNWELGKTLQPVIFKNTGYCKLNTISIEPLHVFQALLTR